MGFTEFQILHGIFAGKTASDVPTKKRGGSFFVIRVYGSGGILSPAGIYSRGPSASATGCKNLRCHRKS
jgi:hypothetical protein